MKTKEEIEEALRRFGWLLNTPQHSLTPAVLQYANLAIYQTLKWVLEDSAEFQTYLDGLAKPSKCKEN